MKFITASFSSSHLHNHNKTNIISIIIILKGDHNDPARVQPALWHQAVLWRTDQLWRGGNKDDWQKYTAAVFLSTFIRLWQDRFPSVVAAWMVGSWTLTAGCIPLSKYLPILRSLPKYDYSTHVSHGPWFVCSIMCPIAPTWVTTFRSLGTGPVIFPRTRVIAANETTMVRSCTTPTTSGSLSFSSVRSVTNLRRTIGWTQMKRENRFFVIRLCWFTYREWSGSQWREAWWSSWWSLSGWRCFRISTLLE